MKKIVILASGRGSNAESIIQYAKLHSSYVVSAVISDQPDAGVLNLAASHGVQAWCLPKHKKETSATYHSRLLNLVDKFNPDWIVLAGYMRLLPESFLKHYFDQEINQSKIINIHPSLLPLYPGLQAYEKSYESGNPEYGFTIHYVDAGMDTGRIIYQHKLSRPQEVTFETFKQAGLKAENYFYPRILARLCDSDHQNIADLNLLENLREV
ncbi:MAG: phosphoribosylglycinamide formyltransferase [Pseudobdellovibrio sp.]